MAWASAELSADQLSRLDDDLPILAGSNVALSPTVSTNPPQWRESGSFSSGANNTSPYYPALFAYDRHHHLWTRPRATSLEVSLLFYFASGVTFDTVAIIGHAASEMVGPNQQVRVEVADDAAFSTRLQAVAVFGSTLDRRLVSVTLGGGGLDAGITTGGVYSNVNYVRVRFTTSGATPFWSWLGEVMLLTRQALPYRPDAIDYDQTETEAGGQIVRTETGRVLQMAKYSDRRVVRVRWSGAESAEVTQLRAAWASGAGGRDRLLWVQNPDTDVRNALVMQTEDGGFSAIEDEGTTRTVEMRLVEVPPYYAREAA